MKTKIEKTLTKVLKKFGYDGGCQIEGYEEDEYFYVRYVQLDDRLTDNHYSDYNKIEGNISKELGVSSVSMDRVDAFPNGFAAYSISIDL